MGGAAAGALLRHQTWSPSWILLSIEHQVKTVRINIFCV